ncbi:MAG: fused DSP-PTPase phosphatase/NAD kinase-like protein [Hyphomicrobiaceae bacterium]
MGKFAKGLRRAIKRVTHASRTALAERSPTWARRLLGPTASYIDMLVFDHGVFRLLYLNRHKLEDGVWRSAQPAPHQIAGFARRGVRTIVNLRGPHMSGSYWLEAAACRRHGLQLVDFQVRSRAAPTREEIRAARDLFDRIAYPMVMHCKSGADRAGLMSVLFLHFRCGVPIAEAKNQLSLRYGHIRQADTGILDAFFERYLADSAVRPMPFMEWVDTVYDPDSVKQSFTSSSFANRIVDTVLQRE